MAASMKLTVILGEDNSEILVLPNGMPKSVSELSQEIKTQCAVEWVFRLQYQDAEFWNKFINLKSTSVVKDRGTIKLISTQTDTMSANKQIAKPADNTKAQPDMKKFTLLPGDKLPPVYKLNLTIPRPGQLNKMVFGSPSTNKPSNKTIMVVGATGSGKTTLINGMINYVLGVEWEDSWRYKLIDEPVKTQACSQTSEVTAYEIYHTDGFQVPFSLTIIDTPGFGDTSGIKQDQEITEQIRKFFLVKGGIDRIDAVCFVVQSALPRLTHTQKYIFDAILSIFGKDIERNIFVLMTFADGQPPAALEAIKLAEIPCALNQDGSPLHFKFNNSVLFAKNTGTSSDEVTFDHMFWKMGEASMSTFFSYLNLIEPKSLTLTKKVLDERRRLETTVEGVQPKIRVGLSKLDEIKTTNKALQSLKTNMNDSKNFTYEVDVEKCEKIETETGKFVTNCTVCNYTCHYPCVVQQDEEKSRCAAMVQPENPEKQTPGYCTVCPNKCHWSDHANMKHRWIFKKVKEKRTYENLKSQYEAAVGETMTTETMISRLKGEYDNVQEEVAEMMDELTECLQSLRVIALRPDPLSTPGYIDILIKTETKEAKDGWQKRVQELNEVREKAVLLGKTHNREGQKKKKIIRKGIFNNPAHWFFS